MSNLAKTEVLHIENWRKSIILDFGNFEISRFQVIWCLLFGGKFKYGQKNKRVSLTYRKDLPLMSSKVTAILYFIGWKHEHPIIIMLFASVVNECLNKAFFLTFDRKYYREGRRLLWKAAAIFEKAFQYLFESVFATKKKDHTVK